MILYKSRLVFSGGAGGSGVSTMYFLAGGTVSAQDASDAHGDFFNRIKGRQATSVRCTVDPEVLTIDVTTGTTMSAISVTNRTWLGEDGGDVLPWATQGLVKFPVGVFVAGRRLVGRSFIPGACEGSNTDGVPNAGYVADIDASAVLLATDTGNPLYVYSPTHHTAHPSQVPITVSRWASLRSRRD